MKRLIAILLLAVLTVGMLACAQIKYRVEFEDNYPIANELKKTYSAGEDVVIKLPTTKDHSYVLYVNGEKKEPSASVSDDRAFTCFVFTMPNEDVLIKIEDDRAAGLRSTVVEEDGKQYLVLPVSKDKIPVEERYRSYLGNIDFALLKAAEEKIVNEMSAYKAEAPEFFLSVDHLGYLCLYTECVVAIDPPNLETGPNGEIIDEGCGIDHQHIAFSERITK